MCKCHPLIHHSLHFRVTLKHLIWPLWLFPLGSYILYGRKWCHCGRGHSQGRFDTFLFKSIFCKEGMIIFPSFNASGVFFSRVNPHAAFCLRVLSFFFFTLLCDAWVTLWSFMSVLWLVSPIVLQLLIPSGWKKKKASISLHLYDDHHHHTTLLLWLLELETRAHSNVMEKSW